MKKRVYVIIQVSILCCLSLLFLFAMCGCGGCNAKCDLSNSCSNIQIDDGDSDVTGKIALLKGCNSCFGCDGCGSCVWTKYMTCADLDAPDNSLKGCINVYQRKDGCGGYDVGHEAALYYNSEDLSIMGCESTSCNCFAGCINGCVSCKCSNEDYANTIIRYLELENLFN